MIVACLVGIVFGAWFAVLFTIQRLLHLIRPQNRRFHPLVVWINLVPLLNLFTWPITVIAVWKSVRAEYATAGLDFGNPSDHLLATGLTNAASAVVLPIMLYFFRGDIAHYANFPALVGLGSLFAHGYELHLYRRALAAAHDGAPPWWEDEGEQ